MSKTESTNEDDTDITKQTNDAETDETSVYGTCNTSTTLQQLADGLAVQYDSYLEALTELIDNAVAAKIANEDELNSLQEPVKVEVLVVKNDDVIVTHIADNGPGIDRETLHHHYFATGDRSASEGILNNMGWGSGNALSWFEKSQNRTQYPFELRTKPSPDEPTYLVRGPVSEPLTIQDSEKPWHWLSSFTEVTGTQLRVPTSIEKFNEVYARADTLPTKMQAIREYVGVVYREVLTAHEDSEIVLRWDDVSADARGSTKAVAVEPVFPEYIPEKFEQFEFEVDTDDGTFEVKLEHGLLDFESMQDNANSELLGSGGKFRMRYKRSQANQGVDIYANGRELETSVLTDLWGVQRHNKLNEYGGRLKIRPLTAEQVPTDNKKTRVDRTSTLWESIIAELRDQTVPIRTESSDDEGEDGQTKKVDTDENGEDNELEGSEEKENNDESTDWGHALLVQKLAETLEKESTTDTVYTEKDYNGVTVDVVQVLEGGQTNLWEVKTPGKMPGVKNVYHLMMYHDHYQMVNDETPSKVTLLSKPLSGNGEEDLRRLDGRKDTNGGNYKLHQQDLSWLLENSGLDTAKTGSDSDE